jgi:hypothetical protein
METWYVPGKGYMKPGDMTAEDFRQRSRYLQEWIEWFDHEAEEMIETACAIVRAGAA